MRPLTARPDFRGQNGYAATTPAECPPRCSTIGTPALRSAIASMASSSSTTRTWRAFHRALNDWIVAECSTAIRGLRASIVIPMQNVEYAVDEIERCAKEARFVADHGAGDAGDAARPAASLADLRAAEAWGCQSAFMRLDTASGHFTGGRPVISRTTPVRAKAFQSQVTSLSPKGVREVSEAQSRADRSGVTWLPGSCGGSRSSGTARAPRSVG